MSQIEIDENRVLILTRDKAGRVFVKPGEGQKLAITEDMEILLRSVAALASLAKKQGVKTANGVSIYESIHNHLEELFKHFDEGSTEKIEPLKEQDSASIGTTPNQ